MIEVFITMDGEPIGHIEIKNITPDRSLYDFADYEVKYAVERGSAVGVHKRILYGFPRRYYNVLALVLQSLNALNEKDLKLERDFDPDEATVSATLARRLSGRVREISSRVSGLHHN
jgi:hypothetical protein